jgi:hypothetical protein
MVRGVGGFQTSVVSNARTGSPPCAYIRKIQKLFFVRRRSCDLRQDRWGGGSSSSPRWQVRTGSLLRTQKVEIKSKKPTWPSAGYDCRKGGGGLRSLQTFGLVTARGFTHRTFFPRRTFDYFLGNQRNQTWQVDSGSGEFKHYKALASDRAEATRLSPRNSEIIFWRGRRGQHDVRRQFCLPHSTSSCRPLAVEAIQKTSRNSGGG